MASHDATKEEFRGYLEKQGVVDALTKVLVSLYEEAEKPANALEFLQQHLTPEGPASSDFEVVKAENESLKARNEELEARVKELEDELAALKASSAGDAVAQAAAE